MEKIRACTACGDEYEMIDDCPVCETCAEDREQQDKELRARCKAIAICLTSLAIFLFGYAIGFGTLYFYRTFAG